MGWETVSLLAFLLIFGMWATSPTMDYNYAVIDGVKHYFLTEEIQLDTSNFDQITNFIFIKYDDPWSVYSVASMILAGIFVLLAFSRNQFTKLTKTTTKLFEDFNNNGKIVSQTKNSYRVNNLNLINTSLEKRQSIKKSFTFFFISILILSIFSSVYFSTVFAATENDSAAGTSEVVIDVSDSGVEIVDSLADSATGTSSVALAISAADSATGTSSVALAISAADSATGTSSIIQAGGGISSADSATGTSSVALAISAADSAAGTSSTSVTQGSFEFISDSIASVTVNSATPILNVTSSSSLSTISVGAITNAKIDFGTPVGNALTTSAGQSLTATATRTSLVIQSGTTITGPAGWDGSIDLVQARATSSVTTPSGLIVDNVVSIGSDTQDFTLDKNMQITLTGQAGKRAFIQTTSGVSEITTACASPLLITQDIGVGNECKIDSGSDLVILTRHLSSLFSASAPSSGGGGGGSSDNVPPSITVGFDQNEFPLQYDGVKYNSDDIDSAHTAIIKTGEELQATLSVYENQGAASVQHIEIYVNQFGSQVLNDLTETIVIYDEQTGLEIIDPHDLITTANVIPSGSGNKAVFDFVIVFKDEIPQSDVLFRLWDIKRNSLELHLPNALIVEISEQSGNIISIEPEESETETELESTVPVTPAVPEIIPETPEQIPEDEIPIKTWTSGQLSALKQWGGYDTETASDIDVLSKFGIKGEKIPSYVKNFVKWILKDQISREEFVNALQFLKKEGMLDNSVGKQTFDVNSKTELEEFTLEKEHLENKIKFEMDEDENGLYTKADIDDLQIKVRQLRSLANNIEIQDYIIKSNMEFEALEDPDDVINQRDSEWQRNPNNVTPFMESLMSNESALITKALIESDKGDLVPLNSIIITNSYGANIAITEKTQDYKQNDEQWWDKTRINGIYVMSGSSSEEHTGLYTSEISIAVNDKQGKFIGIIKAVVNFEKLLLSD